MNNILQIEVLLNMLNTVFAKAVHFKNDELIKELHTLRHKIYYENFNYEESLNLLKKADIELSKYE